MIKKRFRLSYALSSAFNLICKFPIYIIVPILINIAITIVYLYLNFKFGRTNLIHPSSTSLSESFNFLLYIYKRLILQLAIFFILFILAFIQFMILSGYIRIIGKWLSSKIKPTWKDYLVFDFELFGKYLVVSFIYSSLIFFGVFLFIIPGFVMLILYNLCIIILIDKHGGVRRAFGRSDKLVSGIMWEYFGFILLLCLILAGPKLYLSFKYLNLYKAGVILPFILISIFTGLLSPIVQLTQIYIYKDISAQQDEIDAYKKEQSIPSVYP
jgi:hypothetical protein